ncbi:RNA-binding protein, containing PUA domain [Archaeoglobus sulfaticallidus PM70-1]|uniref:RNA-binding protein, containing PUA domain n=1 Tax=Archaeoglobus sulfaticallidus PM70-1 TaxID=387631 RepID=N0BN81_9EURY|nr:RNA-binding protein [Archaeoglobus sulfaticallidus]AGK61765.1 RNA-binding protein, containing PUA domain [Archaeoglobus sulfaticallidus PM70-1]
MKRQRLRKKKAKRIKNLIAEKYSIEIEGDIDLVEIDGRKVYLVNDDPLLFEHDGEIYPTILALLKNKPEGRKVVVDNGALPFVMNGADIMKPGIVYADEEINKGDFVFVTVEGKDSPIAVGIALVDGKEMIGKKGKAVKNIHHLKDRIWNTFFSEKK